MFHCYQAAIFPWSVALAILQAEDIGNSCLICQSVLMMSQILMTSPAHSDKIKHDIPVSSAWRISRVTLQLIVHQSEVSSLYFHSLWLGQDHKGQEMSAVLP